MTIRLDRVRQAVVAVVRTAVPTATVIWAPSDYPRRALGSPIVTVRLARGPSIRTTSVYSSEEPTQITLTVSGVAEGQRVGLAMTGRRWTHDVTAGQSDGDVRDALQALISETGVTLATPSASTLRLTAATPGLLWRPTAIGPSVSLATDTAVSCEVETGVAAETLEIQAYADGRGVEAHTLLGDVLGALSSSDMVDLRNDLGVSFGSAEEIIDLTALAGADWESRASMRLAASTRSYRARSVSTITGVDYSGVLELADMPAGSVNAP